jgi:hypothetical protein
MWVDGPSGSYNVLFATISLSYGLILNIFSLIIGIDVLFGLGLINALIEVPKWTLVLGAAVFLAANFLYFHWGGRYRSLIVGHVVNNCESRFMRHRTAIIYMLTSLATFIGLMAAAFVFRDRWNQ